MPAQTAYLDGELCALLPDGISSFSRLQAAMDEGHTDQLIFFVFDLLYLEGENLAGLPLIERKARLQGLLERDVPGLRFSEHVVGGGPLFRHEACKLALEGVISKRVDRPFLTTDPNGIVEPIHNKAMPVMLTTPADVERWLNGTPRRHAANARKEKIRQPPPGRPVGLRRLLLPLSAAPPWTPDLTPVSSGAELPFKSSG